MTDLGWIGVWLLVLAAAVILVELSLAGLWSARLARRSRTVSENLLAEQKRLRSDVERLQAALVETQALWLPYGRILRWLRHPIAIALIQSYARRRAAAR